ncbi:MAG: DUF3696 domain-containing protein [Herpetosiphonaceae bacterium]|nr:DUF3696 domain-containing protein [Herpetosiphonaceae bacterium]
MIRTLHLHNFKCFADQSLELGPLTLLSGLNGMGKSSVIQSLLLLRQSYQQGLLDDTGLALNGDLVHLGTATDVFYDKAQDDILRFELELDNGISGRWQFNYDTLVDVMRLLGGHGANGIYGSSLFSDEFQYLQAERIGPRTSFAISDYVVRQHRQLGPQGEFTAYFLSLFGNQDVENSSLHHPTAMSYSLINQVEAWMGEVSPGTRLHLTANPDMDLVSLRFSFVSGTQASNPFRATNVGFGLTYTLPILVAALSARPGSLLLLENPEAHLHPKGQSLMGELLGRTAQSGVQVMIETHSDHVLNGIRLAVHGGKLEPENVRMHFFDRQVRQDEPVHIVASPLIDRDGRIDFWPEGFFDEWDRNLEVLLEPRSEA